MGAEKRPVVAVALGSGAAKGWAHIGVLKGLARLGIRPDLVTGCSIGALVGAAYASNQLARLEQWVQGFTRLQVMGLLDPSWRGRGLLAGDKVFGVLAEHMQCTRFADTAIPFGAVATELATGREVWMRDGDLISAVRASCAMPGIFVPVRREGRLLIDGAVVNPVPVSLARAMGAEVVIAVNLASNAQDRFHTRQDGRADEDDDPGLLRQWLNRVRPDKDDGDEDTPSMLAVMSGAIDIMQERITRARMAGDPPEFELRPRVAEIDLMEFHRAGEAIAEGEACVERLTSYLAAELGYLGVPLEPAADAG